MDQMSLFSALEAIRNEARAYPRFAEADYLAAAARQARDEPAASVRIDLAIGLAELFERLAAGLRGTAQRLAVTHL
jgi:hypothetical protein